MLEDLAAYSLDEAVYSPFGRRIDRLPGRGKVGRQRTRHHDVAPTTLDHMRQDIVDVFHHHVDVKVQHPVDRVRVGIDQVAADINTGIGVQDVELAVDDREDGVGWIGEAARVKCCGTGSAPFLKFLSIGGGTVRRPSSFQPPAPRAQAPRPAARNPRAAYDDPRRRSKDLQRARGDAEIGSGHARQPQEEEAAARRLGFPPVGNPKNSRVAKARPAWPPPAEDDKSLASLASVYKSLRIRHLWKELGFTAGAGTLCGRAGFGKLRPTLVWCFCAR